MKGDPQTLMIEMMAKLRAPGEGAKAVPRSPNTPVAFGPNPTQPVMATPGEAYVPPEIVRKPGMFGLLNNLNEGGGLKALYENVAKPIQAFTVAMSMWGAMAGPSNLVNSVYSGELNPLEAAIGVAENVTRLRKNKGEEDVGMAVERETPIIGRMGGGDLNWKKGGNAIGPTDTQPTMMDPGGFVLNKDATANLFNQDEPPRLFGDPSAQGKEKETFDWSKIQNLMAMSERFRPPQQQSSWNPEFHQALYGRPPQGKSNNFIDEYMSGVKDRTMMVASMAAPMLGGAGLAAGGEAGMIGKLLGGGEGGGLGKLLGGGGGIEDILGMMGGGGGKGGGGGDINELIKTITELVQTLKGQQGNDKQVSSPTDAMFGPTRGMQGSRRQQGSNYGAIARNTGR